MIQHKHIRYKIQRLLLIRKQRLQGRSGSPALCFWVLQQLVLVANLLTQLEKYLKRFMNSPCCKRDKHVWVAKSERPAEYADRDDYVESLFPSPPVNKLLLQLSVHILSRLRADVT